jgi:hypothetical protein
MSPTFELQFPAAEIQALASRFAYGDDARCRAAGAAARKRGNYTRSEFIGVCAWKTARSAGKVASNTERDVVDATGRALATSNDEAARIKALVNLKGVAAPTASTLLHFAFPEGYPILDVRALESLGVRRRRGPYPVSFWLAYLAACRELARDCGVSIRTLDKALWQHSKEGSARTLDDGELALEVYVSDQLPPLKGEAKSLLSRGHGQAPRVRALLEAAHAAKLNAGFSGFAGQRIGMEVVVRPLGTAVGDATNALGGIGDTLQSRRQNLHVTYLGELADAFLFDDDAQIREVTYREEPGKLGYRVRFWAL